MELLRQYNPGSEQEKAYKSDMLKLHLAKGIKAYSRENTDAHFTASAWILNPESQQVLLLHHKKLNKWLQPGGHADGETDLEKVARKEAREETSLENLKLATPYIFDIDIHTIPERAETPSHYHYDIRFAYFCDSAEETQINLESNNFQWVEIGNVKNLTNEPSILRMVEKSKYILNGI